MTDQRGDTPSQADLKARSPWAALTDAATMRVQPLQQPVNGTISIPGSKSYTNRALLLAGIARGRSILKGILRSDDAYWCLDALKRLGTKVSIEGNQVHITGCDGQFPVLHSELYIGASGTVARFLPGLLAACSRGEWTVDGGRRLRERPLQPLLDALVELGAAVHQTDGNHALPLTVRGAGLRGGRVALSGSQSSQFISGVLMASPLAEGTVELTIQDRVVQPAYIEITLQLMRQFGAVVDGASPNYRVSPTGYKGTELVLEADASTACYAFALAAATGGTVSVTNLNPQSLQPDLKFLEILERMGCHVLRTPSAVSVSGPSRLTGGFSVSLHACSDQALTVAAIAPFADGPITVTDVGHIRGHESDRIRAACENLKRVGIDAVEHPDGFTVNPGKPRHAQLPSYDDHRVAMAFAVMGAAADGVMLRDPGAVSKTCPEFFDILSSLGVTCVPVK